MNENERNSMFSDSEMNEMIKPKPKPKPKPKLTDLQMNKTRNSINGVFERKSDLMTKQSDSQSKQVEYISLMSENWQNWYQKWSKDTIVIMPSVFKVHFQEYHGLINMKECLNVKELPLLTVEDFYLIKEKDAKLPKPRRLNDDRIYNIYSSTHEPWDLFTLTQSSHSVFTSIRGPHPDMHYDNPQALVVVQSKGKSTDRLASNVFQTYMKSKDPVCMKPLLSHYMIKSHKLAAPWGLVAVDGRKCVSQLSKEENLLAQCYQKVYGEHTQLYHYETKLCMAFPFDLIYILKKFGFGQNDSTVKYPVKVIRNDSYEPYMDDPQFRRLIGKQQEYFMETIIKSTHFREYNNAFQRQNAKSPSNKVFWSSSEMKAIRENLNLYDTHQIPISDRGCFMEKFKDFAFRQEFWNFLSRSSGLTVLNLMKFWDQTKQKLEFRNQVSLQYRDLAKQPDSDSEDMLSEPFIKVEGNSGVIKTEQNIKSEPLNKIGKTSEMSDNGTTCGLYGSQSEDCVKKEDLLNDMIDSPTTCNKRLLKQTTSLMNKKHKLNNGRVNKN